MDQCLPGCLPRSPTVTDPPQTPCFLPLPLPPQRFRIRLIVFDLKKRVLSPPIMFYQVSEELSSAALVVITSLLTGQCHERLPATGVCPRRNDLSWRSRRYFTRNTLSYPLEICCAQTQLFFLPPQRKKRGRGSFSLNSGRDLRRVAKEFPG